MPFLPAKGAMLRFKASMLSTKDKAIMKNVQRRRLVLSDLLSTNTNQFNII